MSKRAKWIRVALPSGGSAKVRSDVQPETIRALDQLMQAAIKQLYPYTEHRADGWPLCPQCGQDELWSNFQWNGEGEKPPLWKFTDQMQGCYACGWQPPTAYPVVE